MKKLRYIIIPLVLAIVIALIISLQKSHKLASEMEELEAHCADKLRDFEQELKDHQNKITQDSHENKSHPSGTAQQPGGENGSLSDPAPEV